MTDADRSHKLAKLREPFAPEQVGRMPRGNIQLDYVGHANTTARLLNVDPEWTWEPVAYDAQGLPALVRTEQGQPVGLWIRLTVCGVTRLGYGSCMAGKADATKELIGDAIRNAAMRFGVALDLWSKEELETAGSEETVLTRGKRSGGAGSRDGDAPAPAPAPAPDSSLQERRHMWSVIRLKFGPDAEAVLHDFCKNMGVASSKDLNAAQIAHILSEVEGLADFTVAPPPPEEKAEEPSAEKKGAGV